MGVLVMFWTFSQNMRDGTQMKNQETTQAATQGKGPDQRAGDLSSSPASGMGTPSTILGPQMDLRPEAPS